MSEYVGNFQSNDDILKEYQAPLDALDNATIHLAWYGYGDYCGSSLVIFERDGKLYEVNGGHCSCSGLEEQWEPEETTWQALAMKNTDAYYIDDDCTDAKEARAQLAALLALHT